MDEFRSPVIIVHGGASKRVRYVPPATKSAVCKGIRAAAKRGYAVLKSEEGTAVSAVIEAVSSLEDNKHFNAGFGSKLNKDCKVQMDAVVMDGEKLKCGGAISVSNVANPVQLAKLVMDETEHCLLCSKKAEDFAKEMGVPTVSNDQLICERSMTLYGEALERQNKEMMDTTEQGDEDEDKDKGDYGDQESHDTVGAVALDRHGNVAFATSTGGLNYSMPGRVGDSALPGCGGYADNCVGAASTTGKGEAILRVNLASKALTLIEAGQSPQEAARNSINYMLDRVGGYGGIIVLDNSGNTGVYCSDNWMSFAVIKDDTVRYGLHPDESKYEHLKKD